MNHTKFILRNGIIGLIMFLATALVMAYTIKIAPGSKLNLKALLPVIAIPSGIASGIFTALILIFRRTPNYLKALLWITLEVVIFIVLVIRFV